MPCFSLFLAFFKNILRNCKKVLTLRPQNLEQMTRRDYNIQIDNGIQSIKGLEYTLHMFAPSATDSSNYGYVRSVRSSRSTGIS